MSLSREEVIRMAREADGHAYTNRHMKDEPAFAFSIDRLERFFNAAYAAGAAAEREACAKLCDGWTGADGDKCAEAIRARGK